MFRSLKTLLCLSLLLSSYAYDDIIEDDDLVTAEDCTVITPVVIGCTNTDPPINFVVTYPTGELECEDILDIEQAAIEPTVSVRTENIDDSATNEFYTLLLVDTTADSPMHPILHFGASNIVAADMTDKELILADTDPFSAYRGPAPPSFLQTQIYNYEWILAKQDGFVDAPPSVGGNTNFDYESYLNGVNSTILTTKYFSSGNCVRKVSSATTATFSISLVLGLLGMNVMALVL